MTQATLSPMIDLSRLDGSLLKGQDADVLTCALMAVLHEPPTTYRGFENSASLREHR